MNIQLIVVSVLGAMLITAITARQMERSWRRDVEAALAVCETGRKGADAAAGAARDAGNSDDPVGELLRRFGR